MTKSAVRVTPAAGLAAMLWIAALGATPGSAAAQDAAPVALVTELSGPVKPELAIHREVVAGSRVTVPAGSKLSLLHYAACSILTITQGTVTVTDSGFDAQPGAVQTSKAGPCPRVHRLSVGGAGPQSGAMVLRGIPKPLPVAPDLDLTFAGAKAADASSVEILSGRHTVVQSAMSVRDGTVKLPTPLSIGTSYLLVVNLKGQSTPLEMSIIASNASAPGPLILQLE